MGFMWVMCSIHGFHVGRIFQCGIRMEISYFIPIWVIPHGLHVGAVWYLFTWYFPRGCLVGLTWDFI